MDASTEKRPNGEHNNRRVKAKPRLCDDTTNTAVIDDQVVDALLEQGESRLAFDRGAHNLTVQHAISLRARRPDRWALAGIQRAKMNARLVGGPCHDTAHRIDFTRQMAFADTADRRIAAHLPDCFDVLRQQRRARTHASRRTGGFRPGVATTDDNDIKRC